MAEKENAVTCTYDLLLYIVPVIEKLPRSQRFVLGDRIESGMLEILELLLEAYYSSASRKAGLLRQANLRLERMRYLIRLCHDLHYLNHQKYGFLSERLNVLGKMVGGWLRFLS